MITHDQPTIFDSMVVAALSSKEDGNMKFGLDDPSTVIANRRGFLQKVGILIGQTSLVGVTYETDNFTKYRIATADEKSLGMLQPSTTQYVDALVVTEPGHALFLPLADCAGVIFYDPEHQVLMVSHLGRHSVEQYGARKSVEYLEKNFMTNPTKLLVWISPSVGKATYPLHAFQDKSLQEVILEQLRASGVVSIETSNVDTAHDDNYYSHSQFLKGNIADNGRFAIVAMMTV
ncbi:MAG TPA: laccase domain-containing protein [Candidatus Saccharimonadales bacterium]|nr:laccase domain-containing protein [Candidatus Saccharimonadales bacterium]